MAKTRVGVVGYGTIGQRLADGVFLQKDITLWKLVTTSGMTSGSLMAISTVELMVLTQV